MPRKIFLFLLLFAFAHATCKSQKLGEAYTSETLKIKAISEHGFVHVSYLETTTYGKVACNGMIYITNNEAVVFDAPSDQEASKELIAWLTKNKKVKIKAVVINHFHIDCLGGLEAFHEAGIPSYASNKTIKLAEQDGVVVPENGFDRQNLLDIGGKKVINRYFGEAHTKDNIISYIPDEALLFGGCMIKSLKGQKGNLNDANVSEWSNTIQKIKKEYPNLKTIVPGHGNYGNTALLDYTIKLFNTAK